MTDDKDHVVPCSWADCSDNGVIGQRDKNGTLWATLCDKHSTELDKAVEVFDPKELLRAWVKASGGAAVMTRRAPLTDLDRTVEALVMSGRVQRR